MSVAQVTLSGGYLSIILNRSILTRVNSDRGNSRLISIAVKMKKWPSSSNDLSSNKRVGNYWRSCAILRFWRVVFWLSWLESRTCGINQRVAGSSPAGGAKPGWSFFDELFSFPGQGIVDLLYCVKHLATQILPQAPIMLWEALHISCAHLFNFLVPTSKSQDDDKQPMLGFINLLPSYYYMTILSLSTQ